MDIITQLSDKEYMLISSLVYDRFGINLTEKKRNLIRGRLNKIIRQKGLSSFHDYYELVLRDETGKLISEMVDNLSTNHSYFFRESSHFDFLVNRAFPELEAKYSLPGLKDLRIWCAGSATGEEPYTLAITLLEYFGERFFTGQSLILATDISTRALEFSKRGVYPYEKLKHIPAEYLKKYFDKESDALYKVKPILQKQVLFKRLNFMAESFPFRNKFHSIFCRNVMIYFDQETKIRLVRKMHQHMVPDTYLFIGHSESLGRNLPEFSYVEPAVYKWRFPE